MSSRKKFIFQRLELDILERAGSPDKGLCVYSRLAPEVQSAAKCFSEILVNTRFPIFKGHVDLFHATNIQIFLESEPDNVCYGLKRLETHEYFGHMPRF